MAKLTDKTLLKEYTQEIGKIGKLLIKTKWGISNYPTAPYPCLVYVVGGQYMGSHGLSNHWSWRRVNAQDGSLGPIEAGYGDFYLPKEKYEIQITIKQVK